MLRFLLTLAIPAQRLLDQVSPTHGFINRQALVILQADGKRRERALLDHYIREFNAGCDWADTGWKNIGHMYNPETGCGLKGWPAAPTLLRQYWDVAVRYRTEGDWARAFFQLGAGAHLVQDLCVPHHASAAVFGGHRKFEEYAARYRHRYAAHDGGLYGMARTPEGWATLNAGYTHRHWGHLVGRLPGRGELHQALSDLLPRAQLTTAGFIHFFLNAGEVA